MPISRATDPPNSEQKKISPVLKTRDSSIVLDHSKRVKLMALRDVFKVGHGYKLDVVWFAKAAKISRSIMPYAASELSDY